MPQKLSWLPSLSVAFGLGGNYFATMLDDGKSCDCYVLQGNQESSQKFLSKKNIIVRKAV